MCDTVYCEKVADAFFEDSAEMLQASLEIILQRQGASPPVAYDLANFLGMVVRRSGALLAGTDTIIGDPEQYPALFVADRVVSAYRLVPGAAL